MKLLPTTIEGWNTKKRLFMRLLSNEPDPEQAEVYENAVNYCDRKIRQVHKVLLILAACLLISIGGCNTARGALDFGKGVGQDGAWILGKMSENINTKEK